MSEPTQFVYFTPRTVITFDWRESDREFVNALRSGLRWRPYIQGFTESQEEPGKKDGWTVLRQLAGDGMGTGPQEVHLDHLPFIVEWAQAARGWFENLIAEAKAGTPGGPADAAIPEWRRAAEELAVVAHLVQEVIDWFGVSHSKATERIPFGADDFDPEERS